MRAAISVSLVQKRTFDVDAGDEPSGERIGARGATRAIDSRRHIASRSSVMIVARKPATPSASSRSHARCSDSAVEAVLVEIDAGVAVDLKIEERASGSHRGALPTAPAAHSESIHRWSTAASGRPSRCERP